MNVDIKLKVEEIFASIQGESTHAGTPCVMVRLAGCNLECFYCDTKTAINSAGKPMTITKIMDVVGKHRIKMVEVTGGEPLLQPSCNVLIASLIKAKYKTLVETNGTVNLSSFPREASYIVDIKTPGSGHAGSFLESNYKNLQKRDEVKFVISSKRDFDWACEIVNSGKLNECGQILYSPAAGSIEYKKLAGWIINSGVRGRLNLQLHKIIWGPNEEGV
ncbi:MAG TPA: radical SAM protein [Nitrospinota bacterium]|jgi:7-carboxy-7-deazaguanine synthase|nr:radical SAM protein [Nitrospinota bacterium]|tara:strand:+ start:149350 stop:150006 length:657 start_codon:yes stop_codon:yes gene_type:complete